MALAKWGVGTGPGANDKLAALDGVSTTSNFNGTFNVGKLFLGGSKTTLRRTILQVDLNRVPDIGNSVPAGATINDVYIATSVTRLGSPSTSHTLTRIIRTDWVAAQATWGIYKTANNWTTAGAGGAGTDIDTTTPTPKSFSGPSADGAFTITGLGSFYTDALASRSGLFNVRIIIDDEVNDGVNKFWGAASTYLVVDYVARTLVVPRRKSMRALLIR